MRTLRAAFLRWFRALLFPATGTRRAEPEAVAPEPVAMPASWPVLCPTPAPLNDHEMALVRPYVIAWELEQERRRAAVPAPLGQDYEGVPA